MLQGIKNIIFDLGGVIYAINYQATIDAFESLGISDFKEIYAKAGQSELFDDLETGKIDKSQFFEEIKKHLPKTITDTQITEAWNAMLLNFMDDAIHCLEELQSDYRIFLLSNTNIFHIEEIKSRVGNSYFSKFSSLFEKVYLSHELGLRKPHTAVFTHIAEEQALQPKETLFIDDSPQHVEGAIKAGLNAYHLKDGEKIADLLRI
mgnify:CR=1 FL=1